MSDIVERLTKRIKECEVRYGRPPNEKVGWTDDGRLLGDALDTISLDMSALGALRADNLRLVEIVAKRHAEIERLHNALKPFADAAARFAPYVGQMEEKEVNAFFTLGQLRAAAAALTTSQRGTE